MSLMRTLVKVGIGIAVAKGVGAMANRRSGGSSGGLGGMLGGLTGGSGGSGGLQDMMKNVLGGTGGAGASSGGIGGLLGGLAGGAAAGGASSTPEFGAKLNDAFGRMGEPEIAPTAEEDQMAGLMLRAMIQAAKSDGKIDEGEKEKLIASLEDATDEERAYVNEQLAAPIDIQQLAGDVPRGAASDVYVMSVMAIDLDNQNEAQYLHGLAEALGMEPQNVNEIHKQLGVPPLYS